MVTGKPTLAHAYLNGERVWSDPHVAENRWSLFVPAGGNGSAVLDADQGGDVTAAIACDYGQTHAYVNATLTNLVTGAQVALMNAGGIRAPWEQGPITFGAVFRTLPFDNEVVKTHVTGKQLKLILRVAESGSRGFVSVSGVKLRVIHPDADAPSSDLNGDGKIDP